jgi:hypothetical protein
VDESRGEDVNTGGMVGLRAGREDGVVAVDTAARVGPGGRHRAAAPQAPRHVRDIVKVARLGHDMHCAAAAAAIITLLLLLLLCMTRCHVGS